MKIFPVCKESKNSSKQFPIPIWNFLSRDSKFLIPQTTQKRIQNFWSPKNTTNDSEFLIPKEHNEGFRISDPPKIQNFWSPTLTHKRIQKFWSPTKTQKYSKFLILQRTQEKIQYFWSTEEHSPGKDSEFLITRWTGQDSQLFIPKEHSLKWNRNFWSPKQPKRKKKYIFLSGLKAVTKSEVKIIIKGFWSKLKTDYKFHHINFIQSPV